MQLRVPLVLPESRKRGTLLKALLRVASLRDKRGPTIDPLMPLVVVWVFRSGLLHPIERAAKVRKPVPATQWRQRSLPLLRLLVRLLYNKSNLVARIDCPGLSEAGVTATGSIIETGGSTVYC